MSPGPEDAARLLDEAAAHMGAGRLSAAAAHYQRAERADPNDFRAPLSLATVRLRLGQPDRALAPLRRAAGLRPDLFEAQHNLGAVAQALGLWDEAALAYGRAVALRPDAAETRRNLAVVLAVLGRIDEAEAQHRWLAGQPPTRLWALTRLGLLRPGAISDADAADMQRAAQSAETDLDTRIGLRFALGEVLERQGRDEEAFAAFAQGNRLKHAALAASPRTSPRDLLRAHAEAARLVIETFSAEFLERRQGPGLSSAAPIFIVGMPRSGSTLIEQILASHPDVTALGETAALPLLLERGFPGQDAALRTVARGYLEAARGHGWRGAGRFVDKTLENYLHVGAIALLFPGARILHAVRDPADTCLSCYRQLFAVGAETLYDLAEIGAEYVAYRQVMEHWRRVLPGRVVDVEYEALVGDPEGQTRRLVTQACALSWRDECLAFHEARRPVRTASSVQVRQPIFSASRGRWRRYAGHLAPLFEALGDYAPRL